MAVAVKSLPSSTMPAASRFDTEPANPLLGPVKRVKTSFVDSGIRGLTSKIAPAKSRSTRRHGLANTGNALAATSKTNRHIGTKAGSKVI